MTRNYKETASLLLDEVGRVDKSGVEFLFQEAKYTQVVRWSNSNLGDMAEFTTAIPPAASRGRNAGNIPQLHSPAKINQKT